MTAPLNAGSHDFAIETRGLTRRHGKKVAIDGLDLALPRGGIHAIVGANGAGKSTLFRLLLGFLTADAGDALILGRDSRALSPEDRGRIGFVNEEHTLPGWMTVGAVTDMQRRHHEGRWDERAFHNVIGSFDLTTQQRVAQLSRGERAGLNLAMAIGQNPELLILDEPTLGLDVVAKRRVLDALIDGVAADGRTILYCSHQIEEVERLADNLVILERGKLRSFSTPDDFCDRIRLWVADVPFKGPEAEGVPGLLQHRRIEGVHHYTVIDQDESFADFLRTHGARTIQSQSVPLDRAVDAFLTRHHAGPQG
ncbi:MAG: transporter ATP-binding protein [Sphingomonas bacterium]|uniref:ABC transporter ATP-binding protein n=1 Tax=Sphingomonas bacterium TaxID=1895847 RepID=UPI002622AC02|nr:ABC transporter ATP-binding protein [Sphingomonas bacterium]MDB5706076.1 transporter ATP-binding protein [Sphingomonas bacterium]